MPVEVVECGRSIKPREGHYHSFIYLCFRWLKPAVKHIANKFILLNSMKLKLLKKGRTITAEYIQLKHQAQNAQKRRLAYDLFS